MNSSQHFLESLGIEIQAKSTRIRSLIGGSHWYTDGSYKEFLLRKMLKDYLPGNITLSRGFVLSSESPSNPSKEQDILFNDFQKCPPYLAEDDVVICSTKSVLGSISVKSTYSKAQLTDCMEGLSNLGNICQDDNSAGKEMLFGAFFFKSTASIENNPSLVYKHINEIIKNHPIRKPALPSALHIKDGLDFVTVGDSLIYIINYNSSYGEVSVKGKIRGFRLKDLAIASTIDLVSTWVRDSNERSWNLTSNGTTISSIEPAVYELT